MYSLSSIVAFIGFGSTTLTITLYVFVEPFSAVTVILNLFSPSDTSCVPVPEMLARESSFVALIVTCSVFESTFTLYSVVFLLKAGDKSYPVTDKLFR